MLRYMLFAGLLAISAPTFACEIQGVRDLPADVVQKLKVECENARLQAKETATSVTDKVTGAVTPENVNGWGDALGNVGVKVAQAAAGVGMAVNEFIKTPAGILIVLGVVWGIFGGQLLALSMCLLSLIIFWNAFKFFRIRSHETIEVKRTFWGWNYYTSTSRVPVYERWDDMGDMQIFCSIAACVAMFVPIVVFIANVA